MFAKLGILRSPLVGPSLAASLTELLTGRSDGATGASVSGPLVPVLRAHSQAEPQQALVLREARYRQVMTEHGAGLGRVAASYARNAAEREDLSQDIALAVWTALARFRGDASLRTFAFRVAHNRAIAHLRKRRPHEEAREIIDPTPCVEACLGERRRRQQLRAAVTELPLGLRQVLTLRLEGMSYAEISEIVGISETNVSVRLTRARKLLRERLGGEE